MAASLVGRAKSRLRVSAFKGFGRLPPRVRRGLVSIIAPSFTVGALAVIQDGAHILFVRELHRPGLALPGGLLKRGEPGRAALARELAEEIGVNPAGMAPEPDTAHVDPVKKRVDLIWFLSVDREQIEVATGTEVLAYEWRTADDSELTPQTVEIIAGIGSRLRRQ